MGTKIAQAHRAERSGTQGFIWIMKSQNTRDREKENTIMSKIIITIVGQDRVGIVAKTCNYLAENNINILDITQTILQEYFNMMMIVDISRAEKSFDDMAKELAEIGKEIGVTIHC